MTPSVHIICGFTSRVCVSSVTMGLLTIIKKVKQKEKEMRLLMV